jgi:hypothetical protein
LTNLCMSGLIFRHLPSSFIMECLVTLPYFLEFSVPTGISCCRMMRVVRAYCRSTSSLKRWCAQPFSSRPSLTLNDHSTELVRTSSLQVCTWLKIMCVGLRCDLCLRYLHSPRRSFAEGLCQNVADCGFFTTSSLCMPLRIRRIR